MYHTIMNIAQQLCFSQIGPTEDTYIWARPIKHIMGYRPTSMHIRKSQKEKNHHMTLNVL